MDRTYEVGGRYEFHPVNAASPFEDNACTATRLLSRGAGPAAPAAEQIGSRAVIGLVTAAVAGAVVRGAALLRRRTR